MAGMASRATFAAVRSASKTSPVSGMSPESWHEAAVPAPSAHQKAAFATYMAHPQVKSLVFRSGLLSPMVAYLLGL
jgi:hypothetical protein